MDPVNAKQSCQQSTKKVLCGKLEVDLYQEKQFIDVKTQLHTTRTLATTLLKLAGESNPYYRFVYGPQNIFNHA